VRQIEFDKDYWEARLIEPMFVVEKMAPYTERIVLDEIPKAGFISEVSGGANIPTMIKYHVEACAPIPREERRLKWVSDVL
jgi:hypothetical protein